VEWFMVRHSIIKSKEWRIVTGKERGVIGDKHVLDYPHPEVVTQFESEESDLHLPKHFSSKSA
jgi:hypothetical protein